MQRWPHRHHLLAPELWQKDDREVPDQSRHELLVEVIHQVADPLAKLNSSPSEMAPLSVVGLGALTLHVIQVVAQLAYLINVCFAPLGDANGDDACLYPLVLTGLGLAHELQRLRHIEVVMTQVNIFY
ncbi:hypothetical protein QOT17_022129 [Balamuthia mandrillaris]